MERCTTREEFCQVIGGLAERFGDDLWTAVVEAGSGSADAWVRTHGGAWLREALGVALTARATTLVVSGRCGCGGAVRFRQHRPTYRDFGRRIWHADRRGCAPGTRSAHAVCEPGPRRSASDG